jgi:hypothetical protein
MRLAPEKRRLLARARGLTRSEALRRGKVNRAVALLQEARRIQARYPQCSFDNIWQTLWLLELGPAERLQRSLIRGRRPS